MQKTNQIAFTTSVLDALPDAIVWMTPVFNSHGEIEDFEVGYANRAADVGIGHPKGTLVGLRILRDGVPSFESAPSNFSHYLAVYQSGVAQEYTFLAHHSGRQFETVRRPHEGGVLSTTKDRSAQREAERKELVTKRTLQSIFDSSSNGIVLFDAVRDETGEIKDFQARSANQKRNELLGLTPDEGSSFTFRQVLQSLGAEAHFDRYVAVVEKETPTQREQYVEKSGKWISISAVKLEDGFLAMLTDVTKLKESQHLLQKQSEYLSSVLNTSLNAVVTMEAVRGPDGGIADFRYKQVNSRFLEWFSKTEEEVIGGTMFTLFQGSTITAVFDVYREAIESGMPLRREVRFEVGAATFWYDLAVGILDENTAVGTFLDITQRKIAHDLIDEQKVLLENLLQYSPSGITIIEAVRDTNGKVVDFRHLLVNDQAEKFIGFTKTDLLTKTNRELDPGFAESRLLQELSATLETGITTFTDYRIPTGQWIEGAASRMDANRLICIIGDVTTFKESQQKMVHLLEELQRSNRSLEEFAYAASHDLQEPLRKIHTFSSRLREELGTAINSGQEMMFLRIESAVQRMRHLIDDLLDYSQVSKGSGSYDLTDLNKVMEVTLQDLEARINETGAVVQVDNLPVIRGDERQLRQMLQNLIGNALKYRRSEVVPAVTIRCDRVNDKEIASIPGAAQEYYRIEVLDNGIGFDQEYAESIFQVFHRLHGRSEYEGTGIGLAIVQRVVQNHGGYVKAIGKPGVGASFIVYLPV